MILPSPPAPTPSTTPATITRVALSLIWTGTVPECLIPPFGSLVPPLAYRAAFANRGVGGKKLGPPWELGRNAKWNRFWENYLRKAKHTRTLAEDTAWDFLVPLSWDHRVAYRGPAGVSVEFDAWLYPYACIVVGTIHMDGHWRVDALPEAVASLREATEYGPVAGPATTANRSLDGLAQELATAASEIIAPPGSARSVFLGEPVAVTAAVGGVGDRATLDVGQPSVGSCLAGLASVGPPGPFDPDRMFRPNSDTKASARVYWGRTGHVIWRPDEIVAPSRRDPVACLHRNHSHALAHAAGLSVAVGWAADKVDASAPVPTAVHPLLARALYRLDKLATGNRDDTYRSEILTKRLEPMRTKIDAVRAATGLGNAL